MIKSIIFCRAFSTVKNYSNLRLLLSFGVKKLTGPLATRARARESFIVLAITLLIQKSHNFSIIFIYTFDVIYTLIETLENDSNFEFNF